MLKRESFRAEVGWEGRRIRLLRVLLSDLRLFAYTSGRAFDAAMPVRERRRMSKRDGPSVRRESLRFSVDELLLLL